MSVKRLRILFRSPAGSRWAGINLARNDRGSYEIHRRSPFQKTPAGEREFLIIKKYRFFPAKRHRDKLSRELLQNDRFKNS